eukprot:219285_1
MEESLNKALSDFEANHAHECICGHNLIKKKCSSDNDTIWQCSLCKRILSDNDTIWQCERKVDVHKGRVINMCSKCISARAISRPNVMKGIETFGQILIEFYIAKRNSIIISDCTFMAQLLAERLNHPIYSKCHQISLNVLSVNLNDCEFYLNCLYNVGFKKSIDGKYLNFCEKVLQALFLSLIMILILLFDEPLPKIDNSYLLNTEINKYMQQYIRNNSCQLNECSCINNIMNVMKRYAAYIDTNNTKQQRLCIDRDVYGNNYNSVDLLNDFNHLSQYHAHHFEEIYKKMNHKIYKNNVCILSQCFSIRRHHRDRNKISNNEATLNDLYFIDEDVVSQQLLDRIHCYYFHAFDTGFKLNESEKQYVIGEQNKSKDECHKILASKLLMSRNQKDRSQRYKRQSRDRFTNLSKYNYGHRFYYWSKYQHYKQRQDPVSYQNVTESFINYWYIKSKYNSMKSELLKNSICYISLNQWQTLLNKAYCHLATKRAKSIYCSRKASAEWYDMKYDRLLTMDHVIAMLVYCNYTVLQSKFTDSCRKLNENESDLKLKQRHSEFYWMARRLRECAECFGMEFEMKVTNDKDPTQFDMEKRDIKVYHGVNKQFLFTSIYANIHVPFSTTSSYAVALSFCENKGMILDLTMKIIDWKINEDYNKTIVGCCDMSWISDYIHESEIFCIGGAQSFLFNTIIEPTGIDYVKYMNGLQQLTLQLTGPSKGISKEKQLSKQEKHMIFRLYAHQLWRSDVDRRHQYAYKFEGCPQYFRDILDLHFKNMTKIEFRERKYRVMNHFLRNDKGWIDMEKLKLLFPNVKEIVYYAVFALENDTSFFADSVFESILSLIVESNKLRKIRICIHPASQHYAKKWIQKYKQKFSKHYWIIKFQRQLCRVPTI